MPAVPPSAEMGRRHEVFLAGEVFGGTKTRASGSVWHDPLDGANHHDDPFAFRWDGKSTKAKQIAVTLDMLAKLREQAGSERPALGLRWYGTEDLSKVLEDWVAFTAMDASELLAVSREVEALREAANHKDEAIRDLGHALDAITEERDRLAEKLRERSDPAVQAEEPAGVPVQVPGYVPRLPWTVVTAGPDPEVPGRRKVLVMSYDAQGHMASRPGSTARVERRMNNRPALFVDEVRVGDGDLYVDGVLRARVWEDRQDQETG